MLVLLFVILSCGVAKPLEHAVRVALNVGENGSYALGPQDAPSELSVVNVVPFCSTVYELVPVSYTHLTLPTKDGV